MCAVNLDSIDFVSAEHAYQHRKATFLGDTSACNTIRAAPTPREAKEVVPTITDPSVQEAWNNISRGVMREVSPKLAHTTNPSKFIGANHLGSILDMVRDTISTANPDVPNASEKPNTPIANEHHDPGVDNKPGSGASNINHGSDNSEDTTMSNRPAKLRNKPKRSSRSTNSLKSQDRSSSVGSRPSSANSNSIISFLAAAKKRDANTTGLSPPTNISKMSLTAKGDVS